MAYDKSSSVATKEEADLPPGKIRERKREGKREKSECSIASRDRIEGSLVNFMSAL